ncbi:MAG: toll/interleukin-1 receptor domain-containing protein [Bacilli bacterium]|nr:toll/interleukin-1 receptor domain-containing protein [Bacilli bacterium]
MADVFISYQHDSIDKVVELAEYLENNGRKCWYAPRDVSFSYASDIVDAISTCRVFVVLIDDNCFNSVHVLNEIEQAYKYFSRHSCMILPVIFTQNPLSKELNYYLSRIQFIIGYDRQFFEVKSEILAKINLCFGCSTGVNNSVNIDEAGINNAVYNKVQQFNNGGEEEVRLANRYYDVDDRYEKRRLRTEAELLLPFEKKACDELLEGKEHMKGLIVTCMYAHANMDKLDLSKFDKIIGFCYNEKAVFEANYDFKSDKCCFYNLDAEDSEFEDKLIGYMKANEIDKFDYMDITMGFLDWKKPFNVLKILKRYMNKDCRIFVRDVDDGVVFAYPDKDGLFKQFKKFYVVNPIAGFRSSGRRIFGYFQKIKAREIKLVHSGIDISDLDYEQKEKMFFSYFGFIPNDFRICYNEDPTKEEYKKIIEWCDLYYDDLEEAFMDNDFFYNSGYFIYTIKM